MQFLKDGVGGVDGLGLAYYVTFTPDESQVYIAGYSSEIGVFNRNATTGLLTYAGVIKNGVGGVSGLASPKRVTLSPDGRHVYATSTDGDAVTLLSRNFASMVPQAHVVRLATDQTREHVNFGDKDVPPQVVSIVRDDANPTSATSVDFVVTFTENVSGVDTGDFALATTGAISGAQVASVSGSGAVYTVSVSTGTGDGTLRLDLSDNDSILGSSSQPLGGAGAGNGSFTGGETYLIDKTAPTISVTFPSHGGAYNAGGWTDAVTGTAADTGGAGLDAVAVSLRRGAGNYWDGDGFDSATEVFLAASGTAAWSLAFADANFPADGSYTVRARATDLAGNVTTASDAIFQYDTTPPAPGRSRPRTWTRGARARPATSLRSSSPTTGRLTSRRWTAAT